MSKIAALGIAVLMLGVANIAQATPVTFTSSGTSTGGHAISASALFDTSGSNLIVTLTNSSTGNAGYLPSDALLGVFFTTSANLSLSPLSAALTAGSSVLGSLAAGDTLGDYWQYLFSAGGFSNGTASTTDKYGISATGGGGMFGPNGNFASGPALNLNGVDGAIVGTDYSDAAANGGMKTAGHGPFEDNSVTLTLSGLPALFDPASVISGVSFIYGTAPDSLLGGSTPNCPGICGHQGGEVPEPASLILFGSGLVGWLGLGKRRRKQKSV